MNYNDSRNSTAKCYKEENHDRGPCNHEREQTHVHEFLGSTKLAEEGDDRHNHRFAGVTGEVIPFGNSHVHRIAVRTDFFDHFHAICILTGPAVNLNNGKHIHVVTGMTTFVDDHKHNFVFTTLIESPLL
ncbi:YmaF family protein [Clostridium hydrogeniformans]|uniref:YmaF family protein n=1 Tax=Clostridium hydrogeniformans TaxID=349933 RepID=UPI000A06CEA7|nr:YmaF family protein [Clostridium hydrogeniformans]